MKSPQGFRTLAVPRKALQELQAKQALETLQRVVTDFSTMAQDIDPMTFYDVSILPHPKELIESALIVTIKLAEGRGEKTYAASARVVLETLTQFQPGVVKVPVRGLPSIAGMSPEEAARAIVDHAPVRARWEDFNRIAASDRERYEARLRT